MFALWGRLCQLHECKSVLGAIQLVFQVSNNFIGFSKRINEPLTRLASKTNLSCLLFHRIAVLTISIICVSFYCLNFKYELNQLQNYLAHRIFLHRFSSPFLLPPTCTTTAKLKSLKSPARYFSWFAWWAVVSCISRWQRFSRFSIPNHV